MKKIVIVLSFIFLLSQTALAFSQNEDRFVLMGLTEEHTHYLDTETVRYEIDKETNRTYINAWYKMNYTYKGVSAVLQSRSKHQLPTSGYQNLDYTLFHLLLVNKRKFCWLGFIDYAKDGSILSSATLPKSWNEAEPGSVVEGICVYINNWAAANDKLLKSRM